MPFKIALTPTYKVKVIVETPNEHGKTDKSDFMAEFKRLDMAQLDEVRKLPQREVLDQVLVGWTGLLDERDEEVPFNGANRNALLLIPQALDATAEAFWKSIYKVREKN